MIEVDVTSQSLERARKSVRLEPYAFLILLAVLIVSFVPNAFAQTSDGDDEWAPVVAAMEEEINKVPALHEAGDTEGVRTAIRVAFYENYQTSGLQDQISHRLGAERVDAFESLLLDINSLAREGASQADVEAATQEALDVLHADVEELATTPEISDQWTRVATRISEEADLAVAEYEAGNVDAGYNHATDAYLGHYEADGLEKATIAFIGQGRVSELEGLFRDLRQGIRDGKPVAEMRQVADELKAAVMEDAAHLDELSSEGGNLGPQAFLAPFLIILREGAEALLVVAAVVTFAMKAERRDQLKGIVLGVVAALTVSVGFAILFSILASTATSGFSQELIEGITGVLAVVMLVYVSTWIHGKSLGNRFEEYMEKQAGEKTRTGGAWGLAIVAFLAVLREGFETILFFSPILVGAQSSADRWLVLAGSLAAAAILAIVFVLVWKFGVRLPLKAFFRWTSILLAILAITIAGSAVKELQDATILRGTPIDGIPEISLLGLYPTVETIATQAAVTVLFILLLVAQRAREKKVRSGRGQSDDGSPDSGSAAAEDALEAAGQEATETISATATPQASTDSR